MTTKATVLMTRNSTAEHGEAQAHGTKLRQSTVRAVIRDNLKPITHTLLVTVALTATICALLTLINKFWMHVTSALIEWLQLELTLHSVLNRVPFLASASDQQLTASAYLWHAAGALTILALARIVLHPPFRATAMAVAGIHLATTILTALIPDAFPYSIADHTRWLSIFTIGLIIALPILMALTHAIIERDHEHRIFGILLIWGFFIVTLPIKLVAHAQLIAYLSRLTMPTLFIVFGPAFDIFLLTALYSFVVTWRHNSSGT
ncbi:MAG: hypothetical protein IPN40_01680 [Uliginosibacterium sp.]|nr:hypothetical protein [Uliginosibacterium sp.]